jgi:hypothetical protein
MLSKSKITVTLIIVLAALSQLAASCERVTPTLRPSQRTNTAAALTARATSTPVIIITERVVTATWTMTVTPSQTLTSAPTMTGFVLRDAGGTVVPTPTRLVTNTVMP